jgi:pimeloyl-ACP methyl ester carboxylesterase
MPSDRIVLVHGGNTASWVWDGVRPLLKTPAVAIDLPGRGAQPGPVELETCVEAILAAARDAASPVIVGHSMSVPMVLVAADRLAGKARHLVLIAGPVPAAGHSVVDTFPLVPRVISRISLWFQPKMFTQPAGIAKASLFNDLTPEQQERACQGLVDDSTALVTTPVPWSGKPPCPCTYVRCLQDKGPLPPNYQDQLGRRLGANARVVTVNAGHHAMISKPQEIADLIEAAAA